MIGRSAALVLAAVMLLPAGAAQANVIEQQGTVTLHPNEGIDLDTGEFYSFDPGGASSDLWNFGVCLDAGCPEKLKVGAFARISPPRATKPTYGQCMDAHRQKRVVRTAGKRWYCVRTSFAQIARVKVIRWWSADRPYAGIRISYETWSLY